MAAATEPRGLMAPRSREDQGAGGQEGEGWGWGRGGGERWEVVKLEPDEQRHVGRVRGLNSRCSSPLHLTPRETRSRNATEDRGQVYGAWGGGRGGGGVSIRRRNKSLYL